MESLETKSFSVLSYQKRKTLMMTVPQENIKYHEDMNMKESVVP